MKQLLRYIYALFNFPYAIAQHKPRRFYRQPSSRTSKALRGKQSYCIPLFCVGKLCFFALLCYARSA